ncbi:MAG: tRNA (adenosine(37)-N6)-dimethylallyltransferase MiaA [Christensenellales bacterium]|jgi:tRNA dimethylallyltransferase
MNESKRQRIVIITGPTATGKTDAAVDFAENHGGEIVSADSMLVYRHMDIGTAKPTKEQMQRVPHHMVDVADPSEDFSAARWQKGASAAIEGILSRGKLPVIAGGTGLYIRSLLYPMSFAGAKPDGAVRQKWADFLLENGQEKLHTRLAQIDPASAARLPAGDTRRIIRALEIYDITGRTLSERMLEDAKRPPMYEALTMGISLPRELLYDRINRRVDAMIEAGLVDEVRAILAMGVPSSATSMQGLGYKEIAEYIYGERSFDEAIDNLKRRTRNFAKRQITWFKKYEDIAWLEVTAFEKLEKGDILAFFDESYHSFARCDIIGRNFIGR